MKTSKPTLSSQTDDRLADFTDRILAGEAKQTDPHTDDELLGLEQTVQRLQDSLPSRQIDDATVKQMQARLNARLRREKQQAAQPFWTKWFGNSWQSQQSRQQVRLIFATLTILVALAVAVPFLSAGNQNITATAGSNLPVMVGVVMLALLAGLYVWFDRRK